MGSEESTSSDKAPQLFTNRSHSKGFPETEPFMPQSVCGNAY